MKKWLVAWLGLALASGVYAGDQDFTLDNQSGVEIHELYVSPTAQDTWGEDILDVDTLVDGQAVDITFSPAEEADLWDVKAVDGEGTAVIWKGLNLLEISKVTLKMEDGNPVAETE